MNKEVILIAKNNYEKKKKDKEDLMKLREELELLKQDEKVKRYLKLISLERRIPADDEFLMRSSFNGLNILEPRDPKIYVYMGAYNRANEFNLQDTVASDKYDADYLMYKNLLNEDDVVERSPQMAYTFENSNVILKGRRSVLTNKKYQELQNAFFEELLETEADSLEFSNVLEKVKAHL